jgi:hypothetical protein
MKKQFILFLIVITVLAMVSMTACGGSSAPPSDQAEPTAETSSGSEATVEEPSGNEGTGGEAPIGQETSGEAPDSEGPTLDENGVPTDVPIMAAMYDLRVEANNSRITYKVDGTIQEVVDFYTAEFESFGWNKILGADSAFGAMGTLSRQNDQLDKLSILLSFNPNGNYVNVTIDIIRAP